ncbi:MAG: InlB B-repeat-containing protein, partial [Clostridia bacterium]|nr:InlB B-repeat-containing protein [Clostridia bacterium]
MIKKLRLYQIGFFIITFAFITLCAYMGITAVQKSMRLNVGFPASPTIKCQIDIKANGADDNTYTTIFNNNGEEIIGTGIELSGNMLKFTETFANAYATTLGGSFVLKITNLMTDTGIKITSSGTGATANPTYLAIKKSGSGADTGIMVVSGNSALATLQLSFSEYNEYNVIISPSSGNFTYTGNSVVVSGENYTATLKANTGYNLAITVVRNDGTLTTLVSGTDYAWNSSNGALTIYAGAITGDININCVNNTVITYTISYNLNGGAVATANPTSYNVNTSTFTLTNPTKTGYNFLGWTGSNGTTAQTSVTISKGVIGNKSYTANWQIKTFTINYSLTNCTSNQTSGASVNYGTSYTATITPSTINLLPTTITVSGVSSGGYSWNYSTGVFSISDWSKVTGNITIAIKAEVFRFVAYSGSQYTGPTARGGSAYAYYCEFGTYPQSYVGTNASVVSGMTSTSVTYAYDSAVTFYKLNGVNKYALVGSRYYAFEPIRWTVLGVDNAGTITFSGSGTAVTVASTSATLFTSATSGLTLSENRLKLNGTTQTKLLFLSEY